MSDTPTTDSQVAATNRQIDLIGCASDGGLGPVDAVTADFARKLERDLLEALSSLAVYQMREAASPNDRDAERYRRLRENWIDCDEIGLHGRLALIDYHLDQILKAEMEHPDTERLNWLDGAFRKQIDGIADGLHKFISRGATLREAIDAYRGRK